MAVNMSFLRIPNPVLFRPILGCLTYPAFGEQACEASSFQDLELYGGQILNITTKTHINLSFEAPADQNHYAVTVNGLNACEVTITYTHPGYNDTINTVIWLPSTENWTGRLLGAGGGKPDSAQVVQVVNATLCAGTQPYMNLMGDLY